MKAKTAIPYDEMPLRQVELLDAAAHAFTEMGFAATTIDSVADLIGVTKGSVYYYYRSKTDLFFAVHRRAMQLNLDTVTPLAEDAAASPPQRLWNMAHAHTHLMMAHLPYQRVTVQGVELHLAGRTTRASAPNWKNWCGSATATSRCSAVWSRRAWRPETSGEARRPCRSSRCWVP